MPAAAFDPGRCWVRHIKRTGAGGTQVLGVRFAPDPLEGINGRQGWQSATPECRLNDDGSFTMRLPNAAGEDGKLHSRRFAILTDPEYRPGEEWLEFYREPRDLLFVGTPTRARRDAHEIEITGQDALVLTANARASEIDTWIGAAPLELFQFYGGVPRAVAAANFAGWQSPASVPGWTYTAGSKGGGGSIAAAPSPEGDGVLLDAQGGTDALQNLAPSARFAFPSNFAGRDWIAELRFRHVQNYSSQGRIRTGVGGHLFMPWHTSAGTLSGSLSGTTVPVKPARYAMPSYAVHRFIARGEWLYAYINGELVAYGRRSLTAAVDGLFFDCINAQAVLQSARFIVQEPLLARSGGDLFLPGAPPAGGLRGRYYLEATARLEHPTNADFQWSVLSPFAEPYAERLESINFGGNPSANPPTFQPPGPPNGNDFSARWTGAIYLDLKAHDRRLRLSTGDHGARVWIGGRLVLDMWTNAAGATVEGPLLRALLGGPTAGWYPIRVEAWFGNSGNRGVVLEDGADDGAGVTAWAPVPAARLSPIGTVDQDARHQSHREVLGDLTESFGYQWRVEPRSLESGEFPGQIIPRVRAGVDTAHVIDASEAMEITLEVDAGDTADALVVDASGLADLEEGTQITHEAFLSDVDHLMYSQAYESLADISEEGLLRTRTESMLLMRSSPNEAVGVRPQGRRELVERFPIALGGGLARLLWTPGDGVRIRLPDLDVIDTTTRQLTVVSWPLRPDGAAPPVVSFRQRQRGLRAVLERQARTTFGARRHPQGKTLTVQGSTGSVNQGASLPDPFSRIPMPDNLSLVAALELHVLYKSGTGAVGIQINSVDTGLTFTGPGPYDVLRFLAPRGAAERRAYATVTGYGTEAVEYMLVARLRA